jgi:hypothetical protein
MCLKYGKIKKDAMRLFTETAKDGVISARFVYSGKSEINDFRLCFSLLSTCSAVSGCKLAHQFGGYSELACEGRRNNQTGSAPLKFPCL